MTTRIRRNFDHARTYDKCRLICQNKQTESRRRIRVWHSFWQQGWVQVHIYRNDPRKRPSSWCISCARTCTIEQGNVWASLWAKEFVAFPVVGCTAPWHRVLRGNHLAGLSWAQRAGFNFWQWNKSKSLE